MTSPAAEVGHEIPYEGTRPAPEFPEDLEWLNTDKPLSIQALKGKVVLLDFWTYCCINCMHVIPDLKKLEAKYPKELVVIGVHSAKFKNEKQTDNIRQAILRYEIEHPVINDQDFVVWKSYGARSWPTLVLINPIGKVIGYTSGEGIYEPFDKIIGETIRIFDEQQQIDHGPVQWQLEKSKSDKALFAYPGKIVADEKSNRLFFTDSNRNRIIVATLDGEILECVGTGEIGLRDGDVDTAQFFRPQGVCFDAASNSLYVADTENHAVRKVDFSKRTVQTLAGTGAQARGRNQEGTGRSVALNSPWDLVLVGERLFIAMAGPHQLWTLNIKTLEARVHAGSGRENLTDGPLLTSALAQPSGIISDDNKLFFADSEVSAVRQADIGGDGKVETLIGEGLFEFGDVDGAYPKARLQHCIGIGLHDGTLYVADTYNHKIKKLNPQTKEVSTFIGTGKPGTGDGERTAAQLNEPNGLCFAKGKMFIADSNNHLIRVCDLQSGKVSTLVFTRLDKLRRKSKTEFHGEEVRMQPVVVSPKAKTLTLEIKLPDRTKLNLAGHSSLQASSADNKVLEVGSFDGQLKATKLSLPMTARPGQTTLTLEADIFYCATANAGLCYFNSARLVVPVEVRDGGSANLTVAYQVGK